MDKRKKKILESKGYKIGTLEQFLGLSAEESAYIELKHGEIIAWKTQERMPKSSFQKL